MWPWEHAIVGYVAYSLFCHARYRDAPGGLAAVAIAFASVLPDLVDKPLAWEYGVFESGYALGHSAFVAVPLAIAVGLLARFADRPRTGVAFGVGYLLHLLADVLDVYVREDVLLPELLLWPVVPTEGRRREAELLETTARLFAGYRDTLLSGDPSTYRLALLGLASGAVVLWLYDGAPPVPEAVRTVSDTATRARSRLSDRYQ